MSTPPAAIAAALAQLPGGIRKTVKKALESQCGGDWSRVVVNASGSFTVHNHVRREPVARKAVARKRVAVPPAPQPAAPPPPPPVAKRPAKKTSTTRRKAPPPPSGLAGRCGYIKEDDSRCVIRVPHDGDLCALHDGSRAGTKPKPTIEPGVKVVLTRSKTVEESRHTPVESRQGVRETWTPIVVDDDPVQNFDWDRVGVQPVAVRLRELWKTGLPQDLEFTYFPDVLELQGVDLEAVVAALHHPSHVEVRPESTDKKYPILGFWKGDVLAVLGLRTPKSPQVIAAYFFSHAMHDTHRVSHTGGGGVRKVRGLPSTVRSSLQVLRVLGAEVEFDELSDKTATVMYKGSDLGKVAVGSGVSRGQVESDYQRTIRKMQAINRRLDKSA